MKKICWFLILLILSIFGCREKTAVISAPVESGGPVDIPITSVEVLQEQEFGFMEEIKKKAAIIAAAMSDKALTGQVVIAGLDGKKSLGGTMRRLLAENLPGAIMLFSYNLDTDKETARSLLAECSRVVAEASIVPFIAVDHEGGAVHRFGSYVRKLPSAAEFRFRVLAVGQERTLEEIEYQAFLSGTEIHEIGITMNFAPVAEILTTENATFLRNRSFGPDGDFVEKAAAAFIRGMSRAGVACAAKHFPGDAGADPHTAKPTLDTDAQTLDMIVKPFRGLVRDVNPPAIMISHVVVSVWDKERNASLSPIAVTRLRGLGFEGIAIADDFSMGAISGISAEDATVQALNAGIDMVMAWPRNLADTRRAIERSLKNGVIKRERLVEAATRIIAQKIRNGMLESDF
ncbi:MAG: glycoside hydrolase family 3 protein [Treponema sp.]|nr:glycoside hydrolase family 3 protein [Treponema sp.]